MTKQWTQAQREKAAEQVWHTSGTHFHCDSGDVKKEWMRQALLPPEPGNGVAQRVHLQCELNEARELLEYVNSNLPISSYFHDRFRGHLNKWLLRNAPKEESVKP